MSPQNYWTLLPSELVLSVLIYLHPKDVSSFSMTSSFFRDLVYSTNDTYLWRQLMLCRFDDPRRSYPLVSAGPSSTPPEIDWKTKVQERTNAEIIAFCDHGDATKHERKRQQALETFVSIATDAPPFGNGEPSLNLSWLDRVLRESKFLRSPCLPTELQLCSQLRAQLTLTHENGDSEEDRLILKTRRTQSRCYVYDFRRYNRYNDWGPFLPDGNVNWVHVESMINVILMNLRELPDACITTLPPLGLEATRAFSAPGTFRNEDWAGVEGTWRRYVSFMDYRDLFAFNYSNIASGPRNPSFFQDSRFCEATRLIEVKLHLISPDELSFSRYEFHSSYTQHVHNPRYPTLYFAGTTRGLNGREADIEGYVRIAADGTVRWKFFRESPIVAIPNGGKYNRHTLSESILTASSGKSSHGVQVGNIRSAMGILGNYSTADHDEGDPVGPFWLYKVPDDFNGKLLENLL
ncbi:hypothetical protein D9758_000096 [Tetrapyrgos nigripes]|uniref:F-box domain-containing protein n=1 Tax=Tetrapyrgos nigripes TaxID=182062 RepID=A0A8H5H1E3_9AGAR|nr:hypothetical protein D9758_000096 [Tetrapyrgos nigripes]